MRALRKTILPSILLAGWLCASGCGYFDFGRDDRPLSVFAAGEMTQITSRTPAGPDPLIQPPGADGVRLAAAANETVAFQVVVDAGDGRLRDVQVNWTDLDSGGERIPAEDVRVFRAMPVRIESYPPWYLRLRERPPGPADYYDALAPLDAPTGGAPWSLDAGERLVLWVDVSVSRRARPGEYSGSLSVSARGREDWTTRVTVEVHDFVLPDARPIATVGGFDHVELISDLIERNGRGFRPIYLDRDNPHVRQGLVVMRELMELAHAHRLDLFDRRIRPVLKRDLDGDVRLDWTDYDAIVAPYLSGTAFDDGIGCAAWPIPFSEEFPRRGDYLADPTVYADTVRQVLAAAQEHFLGPLDAGEQAFAWPYRGPPGPAGYDRFAWMARRCRAAAGDVPVLAQLPADPPPQTGWSPPQDFEALVDIFAPPGEWLAPARAATAARPEHPLAGVWLSPGRPPYVPSMGVLASPADVRALPWFAMKYECTGLFLPDVLHWRTDATATWARAQTRLFYPGENAGITGVLPSARLKRLRRGLQDITYLWILRQRQRGGIADSVIDSLVRYAGRDALGDHYLDPRLDGWVQDAESWTLARRLLAQEIVAAVHPEQMNAPRLTAQRIEWREFVERTRRVAVERIRSSVRPAGDGETMRATLRLDLYNQYGRTVDVRVRIAGQPSGWSADAEQGRAVLGPHSRRRVELSCTGRELVTNADGKLPFTLSIIEDGGRPRELDYGAAVLEAGRVDEPPTIDGLLKDWPMRAGNAAGGFRLLGRRGRGERPETPLATNAYVLTDGRTLYVGFRCEDPDPDALSARASNILRYEQLMAAGEDLVEVILDPGGDGDGPEDLYHLVVKSNGVLLTERGVRSDPPLGRSFAWPTGARAAVATLDDAWSVELAIPLSAFGAEAGARFWGANFARYAKRGAEASSWSGASRYYYHPQNLGTMILDSD